jgi:hypothetical protein
VPRRRWQEWVLGKEGLAVRERASADLRLSSTGDLGTWERLHEPADVAHCCASQGQETREDGKSGDGGGQWCSSRWPGADRGVQFCRQTPEPRPECQARDGQKPKTGESSNVHHFGHLDKRDNRSSDYALQITLHYCTTNFRQNLPVIPCHYHHRCLIVHFRPASYPSKPFSWSSTRRHP